MRRLIGAMILCAVAVLSAGCALAETAGPGEDFFDRGREALMLLSLGETDRALEVLDFAFDAESMQSEEGFRQFVSNSFSLLDSGVVQSEVAVCWLGEDGIWRLGLPIVEPAAGDIEVLVLDSCDLTVFCGYSATTWGLLEEEVALAPEAYWNVEYLPGTPVLMADE